MTGPKDEYGGSLPVAGWEVVGVGVAVSDDAAVVVPVDVVGIGGRL